MRLVRNLAETDKPPFPLPVKRLNPSFICLMVFRKSSPFTFSTVRVTNINRAFFSARMASVIRDTCENSFSDRLQPHIGHNRSRQKLALFSFLVPSTCWAYVNHEAQSFRAVSRDGEMTVSSISLALSNKFSSSMLSCFLSLQGRFRPVSLKSSRTSPVPSMISSLQSCSVSCKIVLRI